MRILNPYHNAFSLPWFKGDLHIHSDASDGRATQPQLLERLRECGFDFAAFADHDRCHPPDDNGCPVLIGNSEMRGTEGGDVLTLFANIPYDPQSGVQALIDRTRKAGGLPVLAHPRIGEFGTTKHHWAYPSHQLIGTYRDYLGMEIYTHNVGSGFQTAIDRLDAVWIARCKASREPVGVWGFATSDTHSLERISPNVGIMVAAEACSGNSLRAAIEKGRFYSLADSEARFTQITVNDGVFHGSATNARMLRLHGCPQADISGDRTILSIAWSDGKENATINYAIKGTEGFLRFEAVDRNGNFIYANPLQFMG